MKKCLIFALAFASCAMAGTVTLTMDEVATQPINGLAVTKGGVTFTFSNPGGNYNYHSSDGGTLTYVQDPSIEGTTGNIGVSFSVPVTSLQFGFVADRGTALSPLATVSLYNNSATPFATTPFGSTLTDPFAEALFAYSGPTPVTNILITPNTGGAFAFAFDNLQVTTGFSPTPAPPSGVLVGLGILALLLYFGARKVAFSR